MNRYYFLIGVFCVLVGGLGSVLFPSEVSCCTSDFEFFDKSVAFSILIVSGLTFIITSFFASEDVILKRVSKK